MNTDNFFELFGFYPVGDDFEQPTDTETILSADYLGLLRTKSIMEALLIEINNSIDDVQDEMNELEIDVNEFTDIAIDDYRESFTGMIGINTYFDTELCEDDLNIIKSSHEFLFTLEFNNDNDSDNDEV